MSFELAVQELVYDLLSESAPLVAKVQGIYDEVSEFEEFPYVTIGEDIHNEDDTVSVLGDDCSITVHSWSRYRGRKETKQIQGLIYNALHRQTGTIVGYNVISIDWENSQSFLDSDGLTRHGVQTFRILTEKVN